MTTPTTARARWIAWPGWDADAFNGFVASEVEQAMASSKAALDLMTGWRDEQLTRATQAESALAKADALNAECCKSVTRALGERDDANAALAEARGLLRECDNALKVVHDALYAFKTGPGATRASDGTLGNIVRGQRASIAALLSPPSPGAGRPTHVRAASHLVHDPVHAFWKRGGVYKVNGWDGDTALYIGEDGRQHFFCRGEWAPATSPAAEARPTRDTRAALLDALTALSRRDHHDAEVLVVDALDKYLAPMRAFVEAFAAYWGRDGNHATDPASVAAARALQAAKEGR